MVKFNIAKELSNNLKVCDWMPVDKMLIAREKVLYDSDNSAISFNPNNYAFIKLGECK